MAVLTIEKEKIRDNLAIIKEVSGCDNIIAVLKSNAYGVGLKQMAEILREEEIKRFAVAEPKDAVRLREWGFSEEDILVMRSTADTEDVKIIIEACATATIGSYDAAVVLNGIAEGESRVCDAHIKIDTGMGRYGFEPTELERITSVFRYMKSINITGTYTHYANAFRSKKKTQQQYDLFMDVVEKIRDSGFSPGLLHASNSSAVFYSKPPVLDAVRVGSALTGRVAAGADARLSKVGVLESSIAEVRWLTAGHDVGYGSVYTTKKPTKVAIVPVGTNHGYLVEKSKDSFTFGDTVRYVGSAVKSFAARKKCYVFVNGKKARVIGHAGINHTTIDVTEIECSAGTPVTFEVSPQFVPMTVERVYE